MGARIIQNALDNIALPVLKDAARRSLWNFLNRQYEMLVNRLGASIFLAAAFVSLTASKEEKAYVIPEQKAREYVKIYAVDPPATYGVAMKKYAEDYLKENVAPVMEMLAEQYPYDPDDESEREHRNSLRNRAEMEVRYQGHLDNIEELKAAGHKLVIASTHADCSERCKPYQGRVYSLDGTSGETDDGRPYVPLEDATDIYYRTKKGILYKNGLLGFNCRHYLVPYTSGRRFLEYKESTTDEQYDITKRQRALERQVRLWKTKAIELKGSNKVKYKLAREKAVEWNKRYIAFSKQHNRAYDPTRTRLI